MDISLNTLKSLAINRLIGDLIEDTLNKSKQTPSIIIVDSYSAKILSSFLTMSEVLNHGIFSIESIYSKRHAFPNYNGIYFLSPTQKSCELLAKDFEDKKPKYGRIHIYFTHRITEDLLSKIINGAVIKRTLTCKELNLSFFPRENNVFDLGFESGLKIFKCDAGIEAKLVQSISDRLFTVCATMGMYPFVQYQKSSKFCIQLADKLEVALTGLAKQKQLSRKGLLLLTDRAIDPLSPLLHDYNYESLIYDLFNVKNNQIELDKKKYVLDSKDELWNNYKLLHLAEAFHNISSDFEDFQKSDLSKVGKSNLDSFEEMSKTLGNMKSYKLKTTQLSTHINLAQELNARYKQNHIFEIIELEQDIITGENDKGKINDRNIFKNFTLIKSKLQTREDFLRLLITLNSSLSISDKDFNVLSGKLSNEELTIFNTLNLLGLQKGSVRSLITLNKDKQNIIKSNMNNKMNFNTLRNIPQLAILVQKATNFNLDSDSFPIKNFSPTDKPELAKKYATKNLFSGTSGEAIQNNYDDNGNLIIFCIGGMARNELTAIQKLTKNNLVNHNVIVGSTCFMTASEYLKNLKDIEHSCDDKIGNDCLDQNMQLSIGGRKKSSADKSDDSLGI